MNDAREMPHLKPTTTALVELPDNSSLPALSPEPSRPTARDMRVVEINSALAPAYAKAGTLELSTEETAALTAAFPDTAVEKRPHDGLFYIPHILISDRLTQVFGPGKWTMLRRWENIENNTIFAEWIMIVRGVYIGESVGAHQYIPSNPKMNYSDALESTRGEALRRIAGKYLSCGSQVWSPAYCRELERGKPNAPKTGNPGSPAKRPTAPAPAKAADVLPKAATEATRSWMLAALVPYGDELLLEYAQKNSILLPTEALTDWPLDRVPTSQNALRNLMLKVETFRDGGAPPDGVDQDEEAKLQPWFNIIVPIPRKGMKRDDYLQSPDTIGSLYSARHDDEEARNRLFGFAHKWAPEPRTVGNKTYQPSEADHQFRAGLDQFLEFVEEHPDA